jgi:metallo-beta-lactamase family protein
VLVSYQAPHSVGHQLLEMKPTVRFHGRNWNKWAEVVEINGFSGHADQDDFMALLAPAAEQAQSVRLVHGEPAAATALTAALRERGCRDVVAPQRGDSVTLA